MDEIQLERMSQRLYSSVPLLGGLLRRNAAEKLAEDGSPAAICVLSIAITHSRDPGVRTLARRAVARIRDRTSIDAICRHWYETRHPVLAGLMIAYGWVGGRPLKVRVYSALKTRQFDALDGLLSGELVPVLLEALNDADREIVDGAVGALRRQLQRPEIQDIVCETLIYEEHPRAFSVVVEEGADAVSSLGDLRSPEIADILFKPLALLSPTLLGLFDTIADTPGGDERLCRLARLAAMLPHHRARFDIELETRSIPTIKVGEFAIEIE